MESSSLAEAMAALDRDGNGEIWPVELKDGVPGLDLTIGRAELLVKEFAEGGKGVTLEGLGRIWAAMEEWDNVVGALMTHCGSKECTAHESFKLLDTENKGRLEEADVEQCGGFMTVNRTSKDGKTDKLRDMFKIADTNSDGKLSEDEWKPIFALCGDSRFEAKKKIVEPTTEGSLVEPPPQEGKAQVEVDHFARRVNARVARPRWRTLLEGLD